MKITIILLFITFASAKVSSQIHSLNKAEKKEIIDSIIFQFKNQYVFPEVADLIEKDLLKRLKNGDYNTIKDQSTFADSLKNHLFLISQDKHVGVSFNKETASQLRKPKIKENSTEKFNQVNERARKFNYGFEELKIMKGNVGYMKLTGFSPTQYGGKTASIAMQFLSNCDALIFDLRINYGGDSSMIQLLLSYLFSEEPVHLNDFYHRKKDEITQSWTLPYVQGKRMPNIPVYVLISNQTISAGEEFAYDLKNLKRGTIIGEKSAGAANFGEEFIAKGNFIVWIPTGRAINPITNTNWEGKGVKPDIKVQSDDALDVAYKIALKNISK
ncbi:hypothetical protein UJ101_00676 [Flavobacteriaceae bacterium UJ101]|nr:hypothetical protein UJ101_00676 [Flavobacteriaceae bacterium UJ101]